MTPLIARRSSTPDHDTPLDYAGGSFRRVLAAIDSFGYTSAALALAVSISQSVGGRLRVVHVRMWDRPVPRGGGRFYLETAEEATCVLDQAVSYAWACHVDASGVSVDAERSRVAAAILAEASSWNADVMVLASGSRRHLNLGLWDKVARRVMRQAFCPVLLVGPPRT